MVMERWITSLVAFTKVSGPMEIIMDRAFTKMPMATNSKAHFKTTYCMVRALRFSFCSLMLTQLAPTLATGIKTRDKGTERRFSRTVMNMKASTTKIRDMAKEWSSIKLVESTSASGHAESKMELALSNPPMVKLIMKEASKMVKDAVRARIPSLTGTYTKVTMRITKSKVKVL